MTTKTDITQERADFEAAYASAYPTAASLPGKFDREDWGDYVDASVGIGWRMWQAGRAAVEADRQGRVPSDDEILHIWDAFVNEPTEEYPLTDADKITFARALLSRYSGQPDPYRENLADQAEAINMDRLINWLTAYGISTPESMESFAATFGEQVNALTLREPFPARQPAASPEPSGYAYRYPDGIRFNDGREVNGCKPTETLPYWFGAAPVAQDPVRGDSFSACAIGDHNYAAGMLLGWNLCIEDNEEKFSLIRGERLRAAAQATRAAKTQDTATVAAQPSVPDGWKLVPVEPTNGMLAAAQSAWIADPAKKSSTLYGAMLAASPTPPAHAQQAAGLPENWTTAEELACTRFVDAAWNEPWFDGLRGNQWRHAFRLMHKQQDADRMDAERYRWVRQRWGRIEDTYDGDSNRIVEINVVDQRDCDGWDVSPESLDAAIDAARAGDKS